MATTIESISLSVVHLILLVRDIIIAYWAKILRPIVTIAIPYKKKARSLAAIRRDAKALNKLPLHLGIVVVEDTISYKDIANIIVWCVSWGVSHISVYDPLGVLQQRHEEIVKIVHIQQKCLLENDSSKISIEVHNRRGGDCFPHTEKSTSSSNVYLISPADGKQSIVEICRQLSSEVAQGLLRIEDIEPGKVDAMLQARNVFPDPDLVIRFGATESLLGYLPWQIRLTEILSLSTHHDVDYSSLYDVLVHYGHTEQRYGR